VSVGIAVGLGVCAAVGSGVAVPVGKGGAVDVAIKVGAGETVGNGVF
jgi:hypothetical protein